MKSWQHFRKLPRCCHEEEIESLNVLSLSPSPSLFLSLSLSLLFKHTPSLFHCSLPACSPTLPQLKQMKELEQEKDSLLAGLEVVERARDWYQGQIHNVTERQRQVGQSSPCTVSQVVPCCRFKNTLKLKLAVIMTRCFVVCLFSRRRSTSANEKNRLLSLLINLWLLLFFYFYPCCHPLPQWGIHLTHPLFFPQDFFTEASQSRMNVLIPKLQEVNRCLNDLITCNGGVSFAQLT